MGMTFLGIPDNILAQSYCELSSLGPEPVGLEVAFLKTEEPSELARISTLDPTKTIWQFGFHGLEKTISGFSLVNHNLTPGSMVRFTAGTVLFGAPFQQAPNAIIASTNATGAVTNVDESISSSDGLVIGPTNTVLPWDVTFAWGALSASPRTGPNRAQLVVKLKREGAVSNPDFYPKLTIELRESGVLKLSLGYRAVTSTSESQTFIFPFDAALLTDSTGGGLECKVICTEGDSEYAVLDTIAFVYGSTAASWTFDSGWITVPAGLDGSGGEEIPTRSLHYVPPIEWGPITVGSVRILSDQAVHDPAVSSSSTPGILSGVISEFPSTFVQAGVLVGSPKRELITGVQSDGPQSNVEIEEVVGNTLGGQTYGADSFRRRVCEPTTIVVNRAEKDFLMNLLWERGHSGAFYIILETDVTLERQLFTSFWATLKSLSAPRQISAWSPGDEIKYSMTIAFEEKL